ncbi:MAG TPA: PAS domain S-box protein [Thermoanaerobaculia bacterium]|jgi:PAS domain S-box-containing protein|nr:PAS domain S-box protein [Thermoanaerobaculia bacterium]
MKPLRAILIEDDEHDLLLVLEELKSYGFSVQHIWVRTAEELRAALEEGCDIVLADYRLPRFSGRAALEVVRTSGAEVPFILVTATLGDELAVEMIRRGADDYVLKDRMARLGYSVDRALREYRARRERAQAQDALAAVQRRFQETFEFAPIGIVHVGAGGRFAMVNDFFCNVVGYTRDEIVHMTFLDITHPDDREGSYHGWTQMLSGTYDVYRSEKRYICKDDSVIWVSVTATPIFDGDGKFQYVLGMVQEITARKEAAEKIRLQGVLLDAVEQAVIATDTQGHITYWSRYAQELYGWRDTEVLGRHILDVTTPQISSAHATDILQRLGRGESWSGEFTVTRRNGETFPVMVIDSPLHNRDGSLAGAVGVSFDLTGQKAAEVALRRSEARYRSIIEGVVELIISIRPDGTIASVNRAFEDATGWNRAEITGRTLWDFLPAADVESATERLAQRLRGSTDGLTTITGGLLRKDGSTIIVDGVAYVARDEADAPEVFYFLRDVTDRTRAEEERARLERKLRLVLESTDEGIYAVDLDGYCTLINRASAQVLGFAPEELVGQKLHDLVHFAHADGRPYERKDCAVEHTLRRGTTERVRGDVFWNRNGSAVPVEFASAPIYEDGAIVGAVITFTDVSQRRMLESQLEKANRLNGLGRIAATIAHEFNNVLMGIQPFAEILRVEARGNERMLRSIDRITTSIRRGKRVTSEILQFTRQSEPVRKPLEVASWLADLGAEAHQVLGDDIDFIAHGDPDLIISGDSAALQQVFMNMVVNARDALDGKGLISITAAASEGSLFPFGVIERGENFAHFIVSDNGPGMPPETMQHIFEPLFTTKKTGTGLGLALAHHIVQAHGGSIFVESAAGEGTTFHIFLPRTDEVVDRRRGSPLPERPVQSLVLVEDDASIATGLVHLLALDDVKVQVAATGGEAVETIERARPDAVVLDVSLPDMDGTMVYEAIYRRWPGLPVVFATGHVDASRLHAYLQRPNVRHVLKPYQLETLYEALRASYSIPN